MVINIPQRKQRELVHCFQGMEMMCFHDTEKKRNGVEVLKVGKEFMEKEIYF